MIDFLRFTAALIRAVYWSLVEAYYALAERHVGPSHQDSWLIARRRMNARLKVNDFFREYVK